MTYLTLQRLPTALEAGCSASDFTWQPCGNLSAATEGLEPYIESRHFSYSLASIQGQS